MLSPYEVAAFLVLLALVGYWLEAMRAREMARIAALRACREAQLQLLDDTVELVRLRLRRDAHGRLGPYREYRFEFTADGASRFRGTLAMQGRRVLRLELGSLGTGNGIRYH
jgi:hypothetical protein